MHLEDTSGQAIAVLESDAHLRVGGLVSKVRVGVRVRVRVRVRGG